MDGQLDKSPSSPPRRASIVIAADTPNSPPSSDANGVEHASESPQVTSPVTVNEGGSELEAMEEIQISSIPTIEVSVDVPEPPVDSGNDGDGIEGREDHPEGVKQDEERVIATEDMELAQDTVVSHEMAEERDIPHQEVVSHPEETVRGTESIDEDRTPPATPASKPPLVISPPPPFPSHIIQATNGTHDSRPQSPALSSTNTSTMHRRSMTTSKGSHMSVVLITSALDTIAASREAKRSAPLRDGIEQALQLVRSNEAIDRPREILEPLRLACETQNEKLVIASLDCISKLVSYSFFADENLASHNPLSPPGSPNPNSRRSSLRGSQPAVPQPSLVDLVTHTIAACHHEDTSDTVSVQIVKALLGLVLSQSTIVHHHALLQSVRTVYNVYLMSATPQIQMLASGSLTQMVDHVFNRCKTEDVESNVMYPRQSEDFLVPSHQARSSPVAQSAEIEHTQDDTATTPSDAESIAPSNSQDSDGASVSSQSLLSENGHRRDSLAPPDVDVGVHHLTLRDLFLKDAFLIFRALCKLSMKPLPPDSEQDPKAHAYRHKVMALQLILHVLNSHMALFVDPRSIIYSSTSQETPTFVQQITPHLCPALSRNAVSPVPQIFEISVEIFWRVLSGMRRKLKKEIEVLLHEIFIPILEMKTSTLKQKAVILGMLARLCQDPQALVEIYLNYDCDGEAVDNIYEHLMNIISKFGTSPAGLAQSKASEPPSPSPSPGPHPRGSHSMTGGVLTVSGTMDTSTMGLSEGQLKRQALECLVSVLRSLVAWGIPPKGSDDQAPLSARSQAGEENRRDTTSISERLNLGSSEALRISTPEPTDDPSRFETAKQRKTTLLEGIKKFNFKPKRGIQFLLDNGFITERSPESIAKFLRETDGLNKTSLGEYLGDGDSENIAIMHAFVNLMDFKDSLFTDSIRQFLQAFRLPGEAQKIDRFLLKFAERYIDGNAKTPFANADAAYILGFSVIMLNTDAHNPNLKKRMSKQDFIKNNRGINDNADLPEEMLSQIFDDIVSNEIVLNDEIEAKLLLQNQAGIASSLTSVGRDLQKEAYVLQTSGMSNKTENLLTMMRSQRKNSKHADQFYSASHFVHVRPMFEVAWMPFLAGLSSPLQETDDLEVVEMSLEGFRHAIRIVCTFDLDLQRNAFVTTLAKFTFLNNLGEMKIKNMEAIKALLDVAVNEGNNLKASWREVLQCVSQLEHMQLIGAGLDAADLGTKGGKNKRPNEELANQSRSTHITVAADMVFSLSRYLSGSAIVDFVRALCAVSWEEIQSSGKSPHPRLFSLQKLVDISYYNMNRIRIEWSNVWEILGEHFNQVCCHPNPNVASFALDALRQLAIRFLEKEELPHFKFQKDFLKPFEYTMVHNNDSEIRDMVLQCIHQMIQAKVHNLRSGWRTMFGVFGAAAKGVEERVVGSAFQIVMFVHKNHFASIVKHGAFADLTVCITEFCKISKFQKISLSAIGMLRDTVPVMLRSPECGLSAELQQDPEHPMDDSMIKYWFPILFAFYDIIMNSDDLEVRRLALESLFGALKTYGASFPLEFWDTVCQELLFPIFSVLKNRHDLSRFNTQEDMSVWLQNTMFQALRSLIDLYTFHFAILERMLDGLLDLLSTFICQETRALSQIGTSCFQQLLESNVTKLSPERWEKVTATFIKLFRSTTPHQLFDDNLRAESLPSQPNEHRPAPAQDTNMDGNMILPAPLASNHEHFEGAMTPEERQHIFGQIIVKCILQLLLIEMTSDLLKHGDFYNTIPPDQLLKLMGILDHSYQFARMFNEDKVLRTELWKVGFMKHLPNLLKQESTSASTLVHVLLQMYFDNRPDYQASRPQVAERLLPLGLGVLDDYNKLRPETQGKNIIAWNPVVAELLDGFSRLDDKAFARYLPAIYPLAIELLARDIPIEIRLPLKAYFTRVGYAQGILDNSS